MLWQFRFLFCHTFVARGSWQKIMYLSHLIVKFHPIHSHASYAAAHFKLQNNSNESNWIKSHQYGWKCRLEVKQQMACLFQLHATLNLSHDAAASLLIFLSANSFICCGESNKIRVFFEISTMKINVKILLSHSTHTRLLHSIKWKIELYRCWGYFSHVENQFNRTVNMF